MGKFHISQDHIRTNALGPCLCVLLHFVLNGQKLCFMEHYSYDIDEKTMSRVQILESFLIRIVKHLKRKIDPGTIKLNNQWPDLSEAKLIPRSNKHGRKRPHTKKYDDLHVIVLRSYSTVYGVRNIRPGLLPVEM
jgi:hypothetical protein